MGELMSSVELFFYLFLHIDQSPDSISLISVRLPLLFNCRKIIVEIFHYSLIIYN